MDSALSVRNLVKRFGQVTAVNGISFDVRKGEVFGLLGPNGAGKTTTIQMILDVITPDGGQIEIFGKSLSLHREEIYKQINFSSSYVSLPWNMTIEQNLRFIAQLFGVPHASERIDELLVLFSLESKRKEMTGKLSSGQLTRVMLAKALVNRPKLLLLDEPTASLDPDIADRTREMLKKLVRDERTTIIYTSHNMSEVEYMCDRIAFLHRGKFLAEGTPNDVIAKYGKQNLEDVFIHVSREEFLADEERL
jgi:ABC-2 type transport system ATP-binding protein